MDQRFREIIAETTGVSLESVTNDITLVRLYNDSLTIEEVLLELEQAYSLTIPEFIGANHLMPYEMRLKDLWQYINENRGDTVES